MVFYELWALHHSLERLWEVNDQSRSLICSLRVQKMLMLVTSDRLWGQKVTLAASLFSLYRSLCSKLHCSQTIADLLLSMSRNFFLATFSLKLESDGAGIGAPTPFSEIARWEALGLHRPSWMSGCRAISQPVRPPFPEAWLICVVSLGTWSCRNFYTTTI